MANNPPIPSETMCAGCKWGKIMIAKNVLEEDEDGGIQFADTYLMRSMCSNPLFVGDGGYAQNMGIVTLCEAFEARDEFVPNKAGAKKPRKPRKTKSMKEKKS
jgi:hypothetical protein